MKNTPHSPFPGMDPYLEHPDLWPDVHNRLITMMANELAPQVRPHYYVAIEERIYIAHPEHILTGRADIAAAEATDEAPWPRVEEASVPYQPFVIKLPLAAPDEVREPYLEVRETAGGQVVTVVELLSPSNKQRSGAGYTRYLSKRLDILRSRTNLVELDLLRGGQSLHVEGTLPVSDYRFIVSPAWLRPQAHLYAFDLPQAIPDCPFPLKQAEKQEPVLSLQPLLRALYEQAGYDLRIDYQAEPVPPLSDAASLWADELLRQAGLRQ